MENKSGLDLDKEVAEAKKRYYSAEKKTEEEKVALACWYELLLAQIEAADTVDKISAIHETSPRNTPVERAAFTKWDKLSYIEVESAETIGEVTVAFFRAPDFSESKSLAKSKWDEMSLREVESASTIFEINTAINNSRPDSNSEIAGVKKRKMLVSFRTSEIDSSAGAVNSIVSFGG